MLLQDIVTRLQSSGVEPVVYPEDTLQSLVKSLEQQLQISKKQNNNISIKE